MINPPTKRVLKKYKYFGRESISSRISSAIMRYIADSCCSVTTLKQLREKLKAFVNNDAFWKDLDEMVKIGNKLKKYLNVNVD